MFDFYRVTPVQIFYGLKEVEDSAEPYALTVVLLASSMLFYVVGRVAFGRKGHAMYSKAARAADEKPLPPLGRLLATAFFATVGIAALLPHLGVVLTSFSGVGDWYRSIIPQSWTTSHFGQSLGSPDAFGAIRISLLLSIAAMLVNLFLGVVIAYLIVRTRLIGRNVLDTLCMLPLAVPGLVLAFGFVAMSLRWPFAVGDPLGGLFSVLGADPNPFPLLVIAYAVRRLPYLVRSAAAGLEQTSGELEEAAINLGAPRIYAIRRVIIPLIMANLIAGGLLVFSFSMLEVSDSMILAQKTSHFPITKMIFEFTNRLGDGPSIASAMGVWGMALLTVTLFGASLLLGKKLGSIFRV
jgi:iron(III) transport system permease protein